MCSKAKAKHHKRSYLNKVISHLTLDFPLIRVSKNDAGYHRIVSEPFPFCKRLVIYSILRNFKIAFSYLIHGGSRYKLLISSFTKPSLFVPQGNFFGGWGNAHMTSYMTQGARKIKTPLGCRGVDCLHLQSCVYSVCKLVLGTCKAPHRAMEVATVS